MAIISLSGKKGSGKNTVADLFEKHLPKGKVRQVAFAAKLKSSCSEIFKIDPIYFNELKELRWPKSFPFYNKYLRRIINSYGLTAPRKDLRYEHPSSAVSGRDMLQKVGTDVLRAIDEQAHLKNLPLGKVNEISIVTDTRFKNELEFLEEHAKKTGQYFVSFFIERPGLDNSDTHASEKLESKDCHYWISNDSSLAILDEQIKQLSKQILNKTEEP